MKARARLEEELKARGKESSPGKWPPNGLMNGLVNGYHSNGDTPRRDTSSKPDDDKQGSDANGDDADEQTQPPPFETPESLEFKLSLLESYYQRVDKRQEAKSIMFDRGLLNYKQVRGPWVSHRDRAPADESRRCKRQTRNGQRRRKTFCTACGPLRGFRLRKTLRSSKQIFSVCPIRPCHPLPCSSMNRRTHPP